MTDRAASAQLFSCRPPSGSCEQSKRVRDFPSDLLTVDIHCHAHVSAADTIVAEAFDPKFEPMLRHSTEQTREINRTQMAGLHEKLTDAGERLADMDRLGIDVQAISPSPFQYFYWADADPARNAAKAVNDGIAELVAEAPERFVGLGTVPMQDPRLAREELERIVTEHAFKGVQLATNVDGKELSNDAFRSFFARVEELELLLFLHPNGYTEGERLSRHYLINTIGNPLDTSVAVAHLILDGVLDDFPRLKICLAHGGGYLPAYAERLDHGYRQRADCRGRCQSLPSEKLRRLHFDTVIFSPSQLEFLIEEYGVDRILLGTDYPYDMGEPDPLAFLAKLNKLDDSGRRKIAGRNAARLLGIPTQRAALAPQSAGQRKPVQRRGDFKCD